MAPLRQYLGVYYSIRDRLRQRTSGGLWVPPLDVLPSAYSAVGLCKLYLSYNGPLVRLRRSTDNVEQDFFAIASGWLDDNAVSAWKGAGDAFVVTRYDQTGNSRHVTQATAANQAKLVTHCRSIICDGVNDYATMNNSMGYGRNVSGLTGASVARYISKATNNVLFQTTTAVPNTRFRLLTFITTGAAGFQSRRLDADSAVTINTPSDIGDIWRRIIGRRDYAGAVGTIKLDGVDLTAAMGVAGLTSDTASPSSMLVEASTGPSDFWNGEISAHAWFQSALSDTDMTLLDTGLSRIMAGVLFVWSAP